MAAYLVAVDGAEPESSALRRWLKDRLPQPMIPVSYTFLARLPISPNGKVDRSALPPPVETFNESQAMLAVPRTATERILAEVVADLAGLGRVGIHRQFLRAGHRLDRGDQVDLASARQA